MAGFEHQLNALTQKPASPLRRGLPSGYSGPGSGQGCWFSRQNPAQAGLRTPDVCPAKKKPQQPPGPYVAMGYLLMISADRNRAKTLFSQRLKNWIPRMRPPKIFWPAWPRAAEIELQAQDTLQRFERFSDQQRSRSAIPKPGKNDCHNPQTGNVCSPSGRTRARSRGPGQTQGNNPQNCLNSRRALKSRLSFWKTNWDTTPLYFQLHPLEAILRRYQKALKTSAEFLRLETEIAGLKQETCRLIQAANQRQEVGQGFDLLLDACDSLADQLDDFETRKVSIQPLETTYHELLGLVRILQEVLDEKA
jgi:hypothetical protein